MKPASQFIEFVNALMRDRPDLSYDQAWDQTKYFHRDVYDAMMTNGKASIEMANTRSTAQAKPADAGYRMRAALEAVQARVSRYGESEKIAIGKVAKSHPHLFT